MDPTSLADKAEHSRHVEGNESQCLRANAVVEVGVAGTWCGNVVVLEDGTSFHDAPAEKTNPCASCVDVGEAMDAAPGALRSVEGRAVGRARHDAETGVRVAVTGHGLGVVVIAMILPHNLGREVAA
jgi:hypothetical protein